MAAGGRPSSLLGALGLLFVVRLGIAASEKSLNSSEVTYLAGATTSAAVDNGTEYATTTGLNLTKATNATMTTNATITTEADGKMSGNDEIGMAPTNIAFENDDANTGIAVDVIALSGDSITLCANASLPSDSIFELVQTGQSSYKIIVPARDNVTTGELPKSVNVSCASSSLAEPLQLSVHYAPRRGNIGFTRGNESAAEGECGRDRVSCVFDANPPVNITFKFNDLRNNSISNRHLSYAELEESCVVREENGIEIRLDLTDASELVCVGENMLGSTSVVRSFKGIKQNDSAAVDAGDAGDADPQVPRNYWAKVGQKLVIDILDEKSTRDFNIRKNNTNIRKNNTWFFRNGNCMNEAICGKWNIVDEEDTVKVTVPDVSMDDAGQYFVDSRSIHFVFYINIIARHSERNSASVDFPKEAVLDGRPIVLCANPSLPRDSNLSLVYGSGNSFRIKLKTENVIAKLPKILEVSCGNSSDIAQIPLHYKPRLGQIEVARESAEADDGEKDDCGRDRVVCYFDANPPANVSLVYHRCNDQNLWDTEGPLQSKNSCIKRDENRLEVRLNLDKITEKVKVVCTGQNSVSKKSSSSVEFDCAADSECVFSSRSHEGVKAILVVVIIIVLVAVAIVAQRFFPRARQQPNDRESFEGRFNLAEARVESGAAPQLAHPADKCASKL